MFGHKKIYHSDIIEKLRLQEKDIKNRVIRSDKGDINVFFINQLTDSEALSEIVIRPIINYLLDKKFLDAETAVKEIVFAADVKLLDDEDKIETSVYDGFSIILFSHEKRYLVANFKKVEKKSIANPELTFTLRGPRDALSENLDANLSLLRYRVKDPNLVIDFFTIGRRTRTRTAVTYIKDIVNDQFVKEIESRIEQIDVDGIFESGELQGILLNNRWDIFPQMGLAERSDMVAGALLEGKVVVIVEGSGLALIAPKLFQEFLTTCEDFYDNKYLGAFNKILRITAIAISLFISSAYVAIVSFSTDVLAPEYILIIAKARANVPFNAFSEALLIEFMVELMREALLRVPKQVGPAIGIVGALIIGQAAVAAGIFSPLMLIIAALALLTSFIPPDYTIVTPIRIMKFLLLIITAVFGLYGLTLGFAIIMAVIVSDNSFGVPYFAPYSPFYKKDSVKSIMYNKTTAYKRPEFLKTKNRTRIGNLPNNSNSKRKDKNKNE